VSTDPRVTGLQGAQRVAPNAPAGKSRTEAAPGFDAMLAQRLEGAQAPEALRWSAHAKERLVQRRIAVTPEDLQRLDTAVAKAAGKGSRESLVLMDDMAFVVSVKNRVVITAVDKAGMKDQVFSNIDSAVIG
jgi:flagellar operon protein